MVGMFQSVNGKLSEALDKMPYDELGISDETKEQIVRSTEESEA